jgi:hypothetical protein
MSQLAGNKKAIREHPRRGPATTHDGNKVCLPSAARQLAYPRTVGHDGRMFAWRRDQKSRLWVI